MELEIKKVVKDLSNVYYEWGMWVDVRHSVYDLQLNETIKVGPFEEKKVASKCRSSVIGSGAMREHTQKNKCRVVSIIEKEKDKFYLYIQKLPLKKTK